MRKGEAGFTMVETLVALALVAIVSLLLFEGMRFSSLAWQGRADRAGALTAALAASDALREIAQGAVDPNLQQDMQGQSDGMKLITVQAAAPGISRRAVHLSVFAQDGILIAESRDIGAEVATTQQELARGIKSVSFRYLDQSGGTWSDSWGRPEVLPRLIEVRLQVDGLAHWPAIVVAPGSDPVTN